MKYLTVPMLVICALLGGCAGQDDTANGDPAQPQAAAATAGASATNGEERMDALKPPAPDSILYFIYGRDGDGARSYELEGGATVSYWLGHEFDLDGTRYFTGFTSKTNDREGEGGDSEYALEDGRIAIGQATFRRVGGEGSGKLEWAQVDTDGYVGEAGANDRADEIDDSRQVQDHQTGDGRYLLAVPTRAFTNGVTSRMFALFLFDPNNVDALKFRSWGYLGSIAAGSENSAACSDGEVMPCVSSTGTLSFGPQADDGLPRIKVMFEGETIASPGQVRALGEGDAVTHAFDPQAHAYQP